MSFRGGWFVRLQSCTCGDGQLPRPKCGSGGQNTQANDAAGTEHAGVLVGVFAVVGWVSGQAVVVVLQVRQGSKRERHLDLRVLTVKYD